MNYSQHFTTEYGYSGTQVLLSELAPKRLKKFVEDIHYDLGYDNYPNSWVMEVLEISFQQTDDPEHHETFFNGDSSLNLLLDWLNNVPNAEKYCDQILSKPTLKPYSLKALLQMAQKEAITDIYAAVQIFTDE